MLCCLRCRTRLANLSRAVVCTGCGESYPAPFGVPIIANGVQVTTASNLPSSEFAEDLACIEGAARTEVVDVLRRCFSLRFTFESSVLQTESEQFIDRLRSSGFSVRAPYEGPAASKSQAPLATTPEAICLALSFVAGVPPMTVGEIVSFNVRIVNNGGSTVSSRAAKRIRLFYHWIAPNGGREVGLRTDFLIDIPPGRGLTMPIRVRAPKLPGRYRLEIMPVMEFLWWRRLSWSKRRPIYWAAISADIEVHRDTTPVKAPPWVETDNVLTYADDHCRAFDLLRSWMVRFLPEGEHTIVEVGGNFYPMVESLPGAVYNVDIDPFGLMTRNILRRGQDRFVNVVADGLNLPFADKSVDLITLFATFHHFPDPVGLLRHLAKKIKPSGLICLMCEPVGQAFVETLAPEFLRELEHGAYEQAFTRWEYTAMIDAAGLEVVAGVLDRGSAKIALRPRSKYQVFAASPAQTPRVKDQRGDQTTLETDLLAKDETLETPYASAPGRITAPLGSRNQMPSGLEGGAAAWLTLKPGSRPRGLARRSVLKAVQFCRARPALARLARYLLRSSPTLEARVKRTIICGRADRTDMPQNASNVRNNQ